ncbi:MAG: GNAT family N-acetyltransferase [Chloroflexota bacterium]
MSTDAVPSAGAPNAAMDAWRLYARHAARLVAAGPAPEVWHGTAAFGASAGLPYADVNQVALYGAASPDEVAAALGVVTAAGVPAVLARSDRLADAHDAAIAAAGFARQSAREMLFSLRGLPDPVAGPYTVRPIAEQSDLAALLPIAREVHGYDDATTLLLLGAPALSGGPLAGWLAWAGDAAVGCAFVTTIGRTLGLWSVMTPTAHRRRGVGSAVVRAALRGAADRIGASAEQTVFWASPAGGAFYAALGFVPVDTFDLWVRAGNAA